MKLLRDTIRHFKNLWFDFILLRIYIPIRHKKPVRINTKALVVYYDWSFAYKFGFIDECEKMGLDWPDECEKINKEVFNR